MLTIVARTKFLKNENVWEIMNNNIFYYADRCK